VITKALIELKELLASVDNPPHSAAVLHLNNTMGQASATSIAQAWKDQNVPLTVSEWIPYDEKARDLSVEVAKAKASGADSLVLVTRVNDAIMITRECIKQGWTPKMIFTPNGNGAQDKAYFDALGKYADGALISTVWYNPKAPDTDAILKSFETDYPNQWLDANSGCAFEGVQIVADAVKRANSSLSADIHAALKTTDMTPILMNSGKIKFDETGQNINSAITMLQAQKGLPRVILPREISTAALQYPMVPFETR
jgi:branched-chain amino acid transport system substrate-binding protein